MTSFSLQCPLTRLPPTHTSQDKFLKETKSAELLVGQRLTAAGAKVKVMEAEKRQAAEARQVRHALLEECGGEGDRRDRRTHSRTEHSHQLRLLPPTLPRSGREARHGDASPAAFGFSAWHCEVRPGSCFASCCP